MTYGKTAFSVVAYSKSLLVDVPIRKEFFVIYNDKSFKSVSVSSNGKPAISGGADNKTVVVDVSTGIIITTFKYESCVKSVAISKDGLIEIICTAISTVIFVTMTREYLSILRSILDSFSNNPWYTRSINERIY